MSPWDSLAHGTVHLRARWPPVTEHSSDPIVSAASFLDNHSKSLHSSRFSASSICLDKR